MSVRIVTGDDVSIRIQLLIDDATFVINSGATVRAAIVDRSAMIGGPYSIVESSPGSAWATSLVYLVLTSTETALLTPSRDSILEVEVDDGGKTTWKFNVEVAKGYIN